MKNMKGNIFKHKHVWLLAVMAVLIAGHGAFLYYLSSRVAVAVMVSAVIIIAAVKLVLIKRRGSSGHLYALFRRWSRL
jgi:uncharacterized membrane protein YfcA